MDNPKTLSEALCSLYQQMGPEPLQDPDRLAAFFLDVAPNLKAERDQLNILIKSGCVKNLATTQNMTSSDSKAALEASINNLCDHYLMDRSKAEGLCMTYLHALKGKIYVPQQPAAPVVTEAPAPQPKPPVTKPPVTPQKPAAPKKPASTQKPAAPKQPASTQKPAAPKQPASTQKPASGNTKQKKSSGGFFLCLLALVAVFFVVYTLSIEGGLATPETNAAVVTGFLALIMFCVRSVTKKKQ